MDTYSKDVECPKCGCKEMDTKYNPVKNAIRRTCKRCGFSLVQAPLDGTEALESKSSKKPMLNG